ncbi:ABC transporter [Desulfonema ishimotonii]|uniref:ABC transporter n=1 Tax=Desulfonema ishimotonii TaxID=45657 RepID=A0A401FR99_9BACT|nr:ABC transporter ATP-binding protein [Desulfonema ishimotonii]GBC59484.1 ABC transporter [Desulfonema ishimotonii]
MSLMTVDHVSYGYSRKPVLRSVRFSVNRGEVVSLLGPNGSGKTTLLKVMLGLYRPESGQVLLEGRPVCDMPPREVARRIAYVPQVHRLAFSYRVMDVVLMGRMPHKPFFFRYSGKDEEMAVRAMERLSIAHLKDRPYTEVSGGERQLALIARALTQGADIFIMDEPVNGLDYGNQIRLLKQIADLAGNGYTFIKTTHFPEHALWVSDRVVMLRDGQVIADGDAGTVTSEQNLYRLYNTRVGVMDAAGGLRVCVPRALQGREAFSGERIQDDYCYRAAS